MKRIFSVLAVIMLGICSMFCLTGCFGGGESAYEIAVRNGFVGTESQWLEYIKGKNGQDGENGVDYEDIRKLYDDLYKNGEYTGSFLSFIKEYIKVYDMGGTDLVANHNLLSSVSVSCYFDHNYKSYVSSGAGVIYEIDEAKNEVYFVTNYHVVYVNENKEISDDINVNLYGMESVAQEISCEYIGGSEAYDVAVLKTSGADAKTIIDGDYIEAEIADYDDLTVGGKVIAIGNTQAEGITVVSGIVSADNKYSTYAASSVVYKHRVFQIDAQINNGNSGGGIYNSDGRLIGLASSKELSLNLDENEIVEGMSYGIPVIHVDAIYNYCRNNYKGSPVTAKKYKFGVTNQAANSTARYDNSTHQTKIVEDVAITKVDMASLAQKIGLKVNDLYLSMKVSKKGGATVAMNITRLFHVNDISMLIENGDTLEIKVKRSGVETTLTHTFNVEDDVFLKALENIA